MLRRSKPQWLIEELVSETLWASSSESSCQRYRAASRQFVEEREGAVIISLVLYRFSRRVYIGGASIRLQQLVHRRCELVDALALFPCRPQKVWGGSRIGRPYVGIPGTSQTKVCLRASPSSTWARSPISLHSGRVWPPPHTCGRSCSAHPYSPKYDEVGSWIQIRLTVAVVRQRGLPVHPPRCRLSLSPAGTFSSSS